MRRSLLLAGIALLAAPVAGRADELNFLQRCAMRTPRPIKPAVHDMARAGYPQELTKYTLPSLTRFDHGGYVGGARLFHNNDLCARGPCSGSGPTDSGTFGTDFGGFRGHLGRVFLAPSSDPSRGYPISWNYRAEGPRVTDVIAKRPIRKAILEKNEDAEHRKHGQEGHGAGGHAPEGGGH